MKKIVVAIAVVLVWTTPLQADARREGLVTLMEDAATALAQHMGTDHACEGQDREPELIEIADEMAGAAEPRLMARITGARSDYRDRVLSTLRLSYSVALLEGCDAISRSTLRTLLRGNRSALDQSIRLLSD